jgi:hypothetical protein
VPALWSVHRAWLECLVVVIRRNLVLLFLFPLVVVAMTTAVIAILPLEVMAIILIASPAVATITPVELFRDALDLLVVPLA